MVSGPLLRVSPEQSVHSGEYHLGNPPQQLPLRQQPRGRCQQQHQSLNPGEHLQAHLQAQQPTQLAAVPVVGHEFRQPAKEHFCNVEEGHLSDAPSNDRPCRQLCEHGSQILGHDTHHTHSGLPCGLHNGRHFAALPSYLPRD